MKLINDKKLRIINVRKKDDLIMIILKEATLALTQDISNEKKFQI